MGKEEFPKQTGCFTDTDTKQQGGVSPPLTVWEDGAGKMTRGRMECIQPKIIPSRGMERNDFPRDGKERPPSCTLPPFQSLLSENTPRNN